MASFTNLARTSADVITVSELTPDWLRRFYDAGMRDDFPYSVLVPLPGAGGYGLWSRHPVEVIAPLKGGSMVAARVDLAEVQVDPIVASVHVMNPLTFYGRAFDEWRAGIGAAKDRMDGLAAEAGDGAVIAAGDFNLI
ncbi:MAG: endonuclease/exonuclease/phosphatase family protein [Mycobacterium sp.]